MLDDDFIELGNKVVVRVVIALEEGFFYFKFFLYLTDNQLRVGLTCDFLCSKVVREVEASQYGFVFGLVIRCFEGELERLLN